MKRRSQERPPLSGAEWEVMKVLWDGGPMALGDINERIPEEQNWGYSTVKTLVRRLAAKGWLKRQRVGNSYLYRPAVRWERAARSAIRDFSDRVLNGLLSPFVAYYAEERDLTPEDIDQLERIIKRQRKKG